MHIYDLLSDKAVYNNPDSIKKKTAEIDSLGVLKDNTTLFDYTNPHLMDTECRHYDVNVGFVVSPDL